MAFRIQTFSHDAGMYLPTNHVSNDLDELKRVADSDMCAGFRLQIVDDACTVVYSPPVRGRASELSVQDIASMLGVPILRRDELDDLINRGDEGP